MDKDYKISGDGSPKYDASGYRIAPERRFTGHTSEWEKRLRGDTRLKKRKSIRQSSTIKVYHILYIAIFIGIVSFINLDLKTSNNISLPVKVTINNVTANLGNNTYKPSNGNKFVHVNVSLENNSNSFRKITSQNITLIDKNNNTYPLLYSSYQSGDIIANIEPNSVASLQLTFELPINYQDEFQLFIN